MDEKYSNFSEFKIGLNKWLNANPSLTTLSDGPGPTVFTSFILEGEDLRVLVSFHSDTKREALEKVLQSELRDFIILPPTEGFKKYRFDFLDSFEKEKYKNRYGLYAYVKQPKGISFGILEGSV